MDSLRSLYGTGRSIPQHGEGGGSTKKQDLKVVTGSDDGTIKVWTVSSTSGVSLMYSIPHDPHGAELLDRHHGGINSVDCSFDGQGLCRILTTSNDKTAKIWQAPRIRKEGPEGGVKWPEKDEAPNHFELLTSFPHIQKDKSHAAILEAADEHFKKPFARLIEKRKAMREQAEPATSKKKEEGAEEAEDVGHTAPIVMGLFAPRTRMDKLDDTLAIENHRVVTCSEDGKAILWRADTGKRLKELFHPDHGHFKPVRSVRWGNSGDPPIVTCSDDESVIMWDNKGNYKQKFPRVKGGDYADHQHKGAVWTAHFSPKDDKHIISSSMPRMAEDSKVFGKETGKVVLWDVQMGLPTNSLEVDGLLSVKWVTLERISGGPGKAFYAWGLDGHIRLYDARRGGSEPALRAIQFGGGEPAHHQMVWDVQEPHDVAGAKGSEYRMLSIGHDNTAGIWDYRNPSHMVDQLVGHTGILWTGLWSYNDHWVVTCSEDRTARVYRLEAGAGHNEKSGPSRAEGMKLCDGSHLGKQDEVRQKKTHSLAVTCAVWGDREEHSEFVAE